MAIVQTGSLTQVNHPNSNNADTVGGPGTTITVPADAELIVVDISCYASAANGYFSGGAMTCTKGGVDTAMHAVVPTTLSDNTGAWSCAKFYLELPDTGSGKILKYDWLGSSGSDRHPLFAITFWKGINTSGALRTQGGGTNGSSPPVSADAMSVTSGDLIHAFAASFTGDSTGTSDPVTSWTGVSTLVTPTVLDSGAACIGTAIASSTGSLTVSANSGTNYQDTGLIVAAFKPAAGGTAYTLSAGAGTYTFTGTAATLKRSRLFSAGAGSYTFSGTNALLSYGRRLSAAAGSYTFTGTAVGFVRSYRLIASSGSYTFNGQTAGLLWGHRLSAAPGAYTFTGTDATLSKSTNKVLTAVSGSYTITGTPIGLLITRLLTASPGSYTFTGSDAQLTITPAAGGGHSGKQRIRGRFSGQSLNRIPRL